MKENRLLLFTLAGINFTHIMDFMIMMPLGPQFKRIFDIGPEMWSAIISSYTFSAAFSGVLAIFFLDFFDRRKALLFLYGGFVVSTVLVGLSNTLELLIAARCLTGLFGGVLGALVLSIVGDVIPNKDRGKAVGIIMTGFSAAATLGVPIGLLFGTILNWQLAFFIIAGFATILFIIAHKKVPSLRGHLVEGQSRLTKSWKGIRFVLNDSNQMIALLFMVLIVFGQFSIIPFIAPYMVANVGFEEIQLIYIYFFGGGLTVLTSPLIGKIADRYGRLKTFIVLMGLSLIPIIAITNMQPIGIAFVLVFTTMFFIFAAGRMIPAQAIVIGTAHPDYRGTFMSIRSVAVSLGQGVAAFCAGLIIHELPSGKMENFHVVGIIGVCTSIISYLVLRKIKDKY